MVDHVIIASDVGDDEFRTVNTLGAESEFGEGKDTEFTIWDEC